MAGFSLAILLNYKLRIVAATVTSLSMVPRGHTLPTELNYFLATVGPKNDTANAFFVDIPKDWFSYGSLIVLLFLVLAVIVVRCVRRKRKSHYEFKLYIEVRFQEKACEIFIKTFQLEPSCYTFAASAYLETLQVTGCWRPKLVLFWPTLLAQF